MGTIVRGNRLNGDISGSMDDEGDGLLYDGGIRRRLESSTPSLSSSTSHLHFHVCFAGGDIGGAVSAGAGALAVASETGDGQAVMAAEGHRWRPTAFAVIRCNRLRRKATKECHVLVAGEVVHRDTCSVA
jgi:hypothetical protein